MGIEPTYPAWKAGVLPLTYTRILYVPVHGGYERRHVLEVCLCRDALLHVIGVAALHAALVGRVMDDGLFLGGGDTPEVDVQHDSAFLTKVTEQSQFLCAGGIAAQGEVAVEGAAEDVRVRVELHGGGSEHVQKVLGR